MIPGFLDKSFYRCRHVYFARSLGVLRRLYWRSQGMRIDPGVCFLSLKVTWPHRVWLRERCSLEHGVYLNAAGPYVAPVAIEIGEGTFVGTGCEFNITTHLVIGRDCLIAAGSRFIDHNHGTSLGLSMKNQPESSMAITVGSDVWIGANSLILQGVTIGDGAVIGAGSVVTHAVPPFTIVAGVPARQLRQRQSPAPRAVSEGQRLTGTFHRSVKF